jgi:hypothetical protein
MSNRSHAAVSTFSATSTAAAELSTFFVEVFRLLAAGSKLLEGGLVRVTVAVHTAGAISPFPYGKDTKKHCGASHHYFIGAPLLRWGSTTSFTGNAFLHLPVPARARTKSIRTFLGTCALLALSTEIAAAGPCTTEIDNLSKLFAAPDAGAGPTAGAAGSTAGQHPPPQQWALPIQARRIICRTPTAAMNEATKGGGAPAQPGWGRP